MCILWMLCFLKCIFNTILSYNFPIQFYYTIFIIQFPTQFDCTILVHSDKGWWCLNCRNSWAFNQSWLLLRVNYTAPLHHLSAGFRRNLKQKFKRILKKMSQNFTLFNGFALHEVSVPLRKSCNTGKFWHFVKNLDPNCSSTMCDPNFLNQNFWPNIFDPKYLEGNKFVAITPISTLRIHSWGLWRFKFSMAFAAKTTNLKLTPNVDCHRF